MSMSIGGASVAMVESRHGGMNFEAYPSRLAMVMDVLDNGALGGASSGHGSDEHKAALGQVAQHIVKVLAEIEHRERRDAEMEAARGPWIERAAARYVEVGELEGEDAKRAASELFSLYVNDGDGLPDPEKAADEDVSTWES